MRSKLFILIGLSLGAIAILYPLLVVLQISLTTINGHFTWANLSTGLASFPHLHNFMIA
jgi:hypothetical protein